MIDHSVNVCPHRNDHHIAYHQQKEYPYLREFVCQKCYLYICDEIDKHHRQNLRIDHIPLFQIPQSESTIHCNKKQEHNCIKPHNHPVSSSPVPHPCGWGNQLIPESHINCNQQNHQYKGCSQVYYPFITFILFHNPTSYLSQPVCQPPDNRINHAEKWTSRQSPSDQTSIFT